MITIISIQFGQPFGIYYDSKSRTERMLVVEIRAKLKTSGRVYKKTTWKWLTAEEENRSERYSLREDPERYFDKFDYNELDELPCNVKIPSSYTLKSNCHPPPTIQE